MQRKLFLFTSIIIGLTFFVPLVMRSSSFIFPFIVPKIVVFRSLALLLAGAYTVLLATNWEKFRMRFTPITGAILLFFASFTISTFVGVDWYHSLWDNHERMLGLFTILHYVLYYLVVTSVVQEWKDWRWLLRTFLLAGSIVMVIGVLQRFKPDLLLNQSGSRVASTLGNPIYVGGYGLFLAFLGWLTFMKEQLRGWKIFAGAAGLLGFLGIFLSGTRGSMLGLLSGMFVLGAVYLFMMRGHREMRRMLVGLMGGFIVLLGVLFAFRQTPFVSQIPALGGLLNSFSGAAGGTASTRFMAWGIAVEAWQERPVFGWGPNNYYYAFNKYYRPEFLEHGWGETWFDNAHNIIMNTLAVQGAFGLLTYLAMFGTVVFMLYRGYRRGLDHHIVAVGVAFLAAHLAQNVFVFENPTSYLYFFFFLAFLNSQVEYQAVTVPVNTAKREAFPFALSAVVTLVILLLVYSTNWNAARANQSSLLSLRGLYTQQDPIGQYQKTVAIPSPHIDDIRTDFSRTITQVVDFYVRDGKSDMAKQLLDLARSELQKNLGLHPNDIRTHLLVAQVDEMGASYFQNPEYLFDAERILTEALQHSPKRQQIQYVLAAIKLNLLKFDEAIALMKQSIENDPKVADGWWRLAVFYDRMGKRDEAQAVVLEARGLGIKFDEQGQSMVNGILPIGATPTPANHQIITL